MQERLLAPDSLHFCENHIYTESTSSVFGEDDMAQLFGFTSCIEKSGVGASRLMQTAEHDDRTSQSVNTENSWLTIVEMYNECMITYPTDKLISFAGLAEYKRTRGEPPYRGSKYYLRMWESTLLQDFLWASCSSQNSKFLNGLNLPSWAWIGHEGPFRFLNNGPRRFRNPYSNRTDLAAEYRDLKLTGPYESGHLPLGTPVLMSVRVKLSKVPRIGQRISKLQDLQGHQQAFSMSSFRHSGRHERPTALAAYCDCSELRDEFDKLLGYLAMDTTEAPSAAELWCAQIATLHDPYPGRERSKPQILSYCVIVESTANTQNEYRRLGTAEVQYELASQAPRVIITLA